MLEAGFNIAFCFVCAFGRCWSRSNYVWQEVCEPLHVFIFTIMCVLICLCISGEESIRQIDGYTDRCLDGRQDRNAQPVCTPSTYSVLIWTCILYMHTQYVSPFFFSPLHTLPAATLCAPQRPDKLLLRNRSEVKGCARYHIQSSVVLLTSWSSVNGFSTKDWSTGRPHC